MKSSKNLKEVKLIAVGDLMLGDMPNKIGFGIYSKIKKTGLGYLIQHVSPILKDGDIVFGNLETPLAKEIKGFSVKSRRLLGLCDVAKELKENGFNILSIANNHIMEHGEKVFRETLNSLKTTKIAYSGYKKDPLAIFKINGMRVGFLAASLIKDSAKDPLHLRIEDEDTLLKLVKSFAKKTDHLIVSLHWGYEHVSLPSSNQITLAHKIIDDGGRLIIGHHSHTLQGYESYKNGLILYSLGNFISDMSYPKNTQSVIFECILSKKEVVKFKFHPVHINSQYQIEISAKPIQISEMKEKLAETKYLETVNIERAKFRRFIKQEFLSTILKRPVWVTMDNIINFVIRKLYEKS